MEPDETLTHVSKRSRIVNGVGIRAQRNKVKRRHEAGEDEDEEDGEEEEENTRAWHSSRIFRVSRASGGKDRHSKVLTAKGLRDRRVRLSVPTAIQFYDLQDRLGYDQPSKAVEWLIKAAADAITELPSLNGTFSNRTKAPSALPLANHAHSPPNDSLYESGKEEVGGAVGSEPGVEADPEPDAEADPTHRHLSAPLAKSACSSTSETSKGSVPSFSRSENRMKARERARDRAKEKEKVVSSVNIKNMIQTLNHNPQSSFTELLMDVNPISVAQQNRNLAHKLHKQAVGSKRPESSLPFAAVHHASLAMDYFNPGIFSPGLLQPAKTHSSVVSSQPHFSSPSLMGIAPFNPSGFIDHSEMQQFSLLPDHLIPVASSNDYNLNFSMSSLAGYNRGTLQSNSSPLPHIQKFSAPISADGPNMPFFIGTTAAAAAAAAAENQFPAGLDGRLQLCYGEGCRHLDLKGKGKS